MSPTMSTPGRHQTEYSTGDTLCFGPSAKPVGTLYGNNVKTKAHRVTMRNPQMPITTSGVRLQFNAMQVSLLSSNARGYLHFGFDFPNYLAATSTSSDAGNS